MEWASIGFPEAMKTSAPVHGLLLADTEATSQEANVLVGNTLRAAAGWDEGQHLKHAAKLCCEHRVGWASVAEWAARNCCGVAFCTRAPGDSTCDIEEMHTAGADDRPTAAVLAPSIPTLLNSRHTAQELTGCYILHRFFTLAARQRMVHVKCLDDQQMQRQSLTFAPMLLVPGVREQAAQTQIRTDLSLHSIALCLLDPGRALSGWWCGAGAAHPFQVDVPIDGVVMDHAQSLIVPHVNGICHAP